MKSKKLVCGVGINDADYVVCSGSGKQRVWCPYYHVWHGMLIRCYNTAYQAKGKTYIGCTVAPEWHSFVKFREWMESQDWQGKQLDKDLLIPGNKIYSPDTCIFVSSAVNKFTIDAAAIRGEWPIGVNWHKHREKFQSRCRNPFTGKREALGYFLDPETAHQAWLDRKRELANQLAGLQSDQRLAKALRERYI